MPEMKGITVKIPADLHAEVKAYLEAHGITMGEFIAQAVDHELHPNLEQEDKNMERMRTLAFQVPDSLFQRVKAYLERNHMTQKQFVIGLIESEIEQDEAQYQASHPEEQEDEEEFDEQTDEETQDEIGPQEAQEGPDAGLEEQPAAQEDAAPVDGFETGSEEVSQEDDGAEESWEEEAQETEEAFGDSEVLGSDSLDDVEEGEDSELEETLEDSLVDEEAWGESTGQEDAQDEEEQEDSPYSMSM